MPMKPVSGPPYTCLVRTRLKQFHKPRPRQGQKWISPYEVEHSSDDVLELMKKVTY